MRVETIRDRAGWHELRSGWDRLLAASSASTTFLTWEYLNAWLTAYGALDDLHVLTAVDGSNVLRGIAPLRRSTARRYGQNYETLAFIGDGSNDSDYLDFIAEQGFEAPVLDAFWPTLAEAVGRGVLLGLNEIPAGSPTPALLKDLAGGSNLWTEAPVPCATIRLPESWADYLASMRPRFRTKIRSVLRQFESRGDVRFGWCETHEDVQRLLPILFDLHTRRWNHDGKPGVFGWDQKRRFYDELSRALLEQGSLRLSWLEWNGTILACQYGFRHRDTYLHLQEGYEPACEHWNVGIGLRAWTIGRFLDEGVREYDFLAGVGRHKMDWGAEVKESRQIVVASSTPKNRLFCHGPEWERRAKSTAERLLPERLLALRRSRLQAKQNGSRDQAPQGGQLLRKAAARCYLHLGVPAAARLVHERYQLSVPREGLRKASLSRRREPTARILYYHRVNDDKDPFFPSSPISVFERQIQFVARRYRVVSLSRMIEHLESGTPGTVFAITFDDGYRDNFDNALPILERYGVPATIFLSTGSLDTCDPLWFERLAGTLKTTKKEFIDLEIDLPRRFWLRTTAERLRANDEIFLLLRRMSEDSRRGHLAAILKELANADAAPRRNLMLTWDQVRDMTQRGIEFGGHTVTHPFLSRLTREQTRWEVGECKRRIEAEVQAPVRHFAYPNGRHEDFTPTSKEVLREAGYEAALSTIWGLNDSATDRMELRRGGAWEDDEAMFASKMDWYQLVNG